MENVKKSELIAMIADQAGLTKKDAEASLDAFMDVVTAQLQKGKKITLTGFGAFKVMDRAERQGVNPKTGERITIPAMTVPKFTAGKALKDAVR